LPHQIDHLLEQPELIVVPHTAAEDDALPWLGAQGTGHDGLHVAPVEAEQGKPKRRRRAQRIALRRQSRVPVRPV
jgi:hypothetical protein